MREKALINDRAFLEIYLLKRIGTISSLLIIRKGMKHNYKKK
jgi:hypothetical protein